MLPRSELIRKNDFVLIAATDAKHAIIGKREPPELTADFSLETGALEQASADLDKIAHHGHLQS